MDEILERLGLKGDSFKELLWYFKLNYQSNLMALWNSILELCIDLGLISPQGLGMKVSIPAGQTKEYALPLPEKHVCVCTWIEMDASVEDIYFTFYYNPRELMEKVRIRTRLPMSWIDCKTNLIQYEIPIIRVKQSIRTIPKWSVYLKFENQSTQDGDVYIYLPFWLTDEKVAVNLWMAVFKNTGWLLKKVAVEEKSLEDVIKEVIKVGRIEL